MSKAATVTGDATPTILVLFGATGDLARRLVLPSIFELHCAGMLPPKFHLIGLGRGVDNTDDFVEHVASAVDEFGDGRPAQQWESFASEISFAAGDFTVDDPGQLLTTLDHARQQVGDDAQVAYYMALPPSLFGPFSQAMAAHGLSDGARVVFEKPFGTSKESFGELNTLVDSVFRDDQVYRIDHFLGKEATQNLHVTRFGNVFFESSWSRKDITSIEIDVPEALDVAQRAEFYDATGAVLDMLVTHLLQVAAEVTMEPPASMAADDLATARQNVIADFRPIDPKEVVLGQFSGYRDIEKVAPDSRQNTFVAARMWIDNERWRGVPILLRTGKRMAVSAQRVSITFREPVGPLGDIHDDATVLTFDLKGDGAVDLQFAVKEPGQGLSIGPGTARLSLDSVGEQEPLSPYARLLIDFLAGDRSLFTRADGLAHTWEVVDPLLKADLDPIEYPKGSMGPQEADALAPDGRWQLDQATSPA